MGYDVCPATPCQNRTLQCDMYKSNPLGGFLSFDTFPSSVLTLYIVMTLQQWSTVMYAVMDAWSSVAVVLFVVFILLLPYVRRRSLPLASSALVGKHPFGIWAGPVRRDSGLECDVTGARYLSIHPLTCPYPNPMGRWKGRQPHRENSQSLLCQL